MSEHEEIPPEQRSWDREEVSHAAAAYQGGLDSGLNAGYQMGMAMAVHPVRPKPPLGLIPKYLWDERRFDDVNEAIGRYLEANYPIPTAWIDERDALAAMIKERDH